MFVQQSTTATILLSSFDSNDSGGNTATTAIVWTSATIAPSTNSISNISPYCYKLILTSSETAALGQIQLYLVNGSNLPVTNITLYVVSFDPTGANYGSGGGSDPWTTALPGSYSSGQAGYIVGNNLDTNVGSRSTYSGGAVASVTAGVTVSTNSDKTGYALTSGEHDAIANDLLDIANGVESSYTVRQALRLMLSALAAKLSVSGSTVTMRDVNDTTNRIIATCDTTGQRTAVTLSP